MVHDHPALTVLTCWEGPVIAAVTDWVATHFRQTVTHLITESAPEQILVAGHTRSKNHLYEQLVFALSRPADHRVILAGHAACLDALDLPTCGEIKLMLPAMAVLQRWFPAARICGLWLDAQEQIVQLCPTPLPPA